jgi:hypothetical protein
MHHGGYGFSSRDDRLLVDNGPASPEIRNEIIINFGR